MTRIHQASQLSPPDTTDGVLVLIRGALGDVLLTLPFLSALPAHFGVSGLTLVGNAGNLSLLSNQPFVRSIHNQDRAGWAGLYETPPRLPPDLLAIVRSHRVGLVQARNPQDPTVSGLKRLGLETVLVIPSRPPADRMIHLTDYIFSVSGVTPRPGWTLIKPTAAGLAEARAFLDARQLADKPWLVIHPGSGSAKKNWPLENWLALAESIQREWKIFPLLLLGPAETGREVMIARSGLDIPVARGLSLTTLAGLLSLAVGYAGHDSGVTHLAAGLGRPTVAVFGPTNPALWAPRGPLVRILAPRKAEMAASPWDWLSVTDIRSALMDLTEEY